MEGTIHQPNRDFLCGFCAAIKLQELMGLIGKLEEAKGQIEELKALVSTKEDREEEIKEELKEAKKQLEEIKAKENKDKEEANNTWAKIVTENKIGPSL